mmetsp:Transcript_5944/g.16907  ORF Transcript_5944/g.16907 Transcript_5944/m.16907 type:complete len:183 (+) Transcript_5944:49-597(+)
MDCITCRKEYRRHKCDKQEKDRVGNSRMESSVQSVRKRKLDNSAAVTGADGASEMKSSTNASHQKSLSPQPERGESEENREGAATASNATRTKEGTAASGDTKGMNHSVASQQTASSVPAERQTGAAKQSISGLWKRYDLTAPQGTAKHDREELELLKKQVWKREYLVPYNGVNAKASKLKW